MTGAQGQNLGQWIVVKEKDNLQAASRTAVNLSTTLQKEAMKHVEHLKEEDRLGTVVNLKLLILQDFISTLRQDHTSTTSYDKNLPQKTSQ